MIEVKIHDVIKLKTTEFTFDKILIKDNVELINVTYEDGTQTPEFIDKSFTINESNGIISIDGLIKNTVTYLLTFRNKNEILKSKDYVVNIKGIE